MKKWVIRLLILIICVTIFSACNRKSTTQPFQEKITASFDQEIETTQPFPTVTQLPTKTFNTETPIPSVPRTPYPTLSSADPKFLFPVGGDTLVIQNTFADGRRLIQLPPSGRFPFLYHAISPDGKWCAYFTGYDYDNPVGMTLNLFNLEDGSTQEIMQ
ncbi:MAG: hypothetical protein MUO40_04570, partial [Anaerolineaceae bacterium]|nr:hypothetical protein [Anaerolineaceae bacterium]